MKIHLSLAVGLISALGLTAAPSFKLAVSEYPSWSLFLTSHDLGLIDMNEGAMGPIEKKWDVDIVLVETDYDTCITLYGSGQADAACLTNMDSLAPSLQIPSVAILPTSTSAGADQCIVSDKYETLEDLVGVPVYGLENSVSQYLFDRYVEEHGRTPDEFDFTMMDPAAAATAFLQGKLDAIVVWNPFCLEIKSQISSAKTLFSSESIPDEIIDMVTMSRKSLEKEGGDRFAKAIVDTYYSFCKLLDDPKTHDAALVALGKRFSNLGLAEMEVIVEETSFYSTPESASELFLGEDVRLTMSKVTDFCVRQGIVEKAPSLAYGDSDESADLIFTTEYTDAVANQ